jgi:hypothetical protein
VSNDIPIRNAENYADLTAHDALAAVAKEEDAQAVREPAPRLPGRKRLVVYVCSAFRGDTERNTRLAHRYCRFVINRNAVPIAVHLHYPQFLDDNVRRERCIGLSCGIAILKRCDALWVFGDRITSGMKAEIQAAQRLGIPIRRFNSICKEVQTV